MYSRTCFRAEEAQVGQVLTPLSDEIRKTLREDDIKAVGEVQRAAHTSLTSKYVYDSSSPSSLQYNQMRGTVCDGQEVLEGCVRVPLHRRQWRKRRNGDGPARQHSSRVAPCIGEGVIVRKFVQTWDVVVTRAGSWCLGSVLDKPLGSQRFDFVDATGLAVVGSAGVHGGKFEVRRRRLPRESRQRWSAARHIPWHALALAGTKSRHTDRPNSKNVELVTYRCTTCA